MFSFIIIIIIIIIRSDLEIQEARLYRNVGFFHLYFLSLEGGGGGGGEGA